MINIHNFFTRLPNRWRWLALLAGCVLLGALLAASAGALGDFEGESDVGGPLRAGSTIYDTASGEYHVALTCGKRQTPSIMCGSKFPET